MNKTSHLMKGFEAFVCLLRLIQVLWSESKLLKTNRFCFLLIRFCVSTCYLVLKSSPLFLSMFAPHFGSETTASTIFY